MDVSLGGGRGGLRLRLISVLSEEKLMWDTDSGSSMVGSCSLMEEMDLGLGLPSGSLVGLDRNVDRIFSGILLSFLAEDLPRDWASSYSDKSGK